MANSPGMITAVLSELGKFGEARALLHNQHERIIDAASQERELARLEQAFTGMSSALRHLQDARTDAIAYVLRNLEMAEFAAFERDIVIAIVRECEHQYGVASYNYQPLIADIRRTIAIDIIRKR